MSYIYDLVNSAGDHADNVTLKKVSGGDVNKWGDRTGESTEEVEITAMVELLTGEAQEVAEGDFESGDIRAFIDDSESGISEGNVLVYQDKDYRIDEVLKIEVGHEAHYEVRASRV